MLCESHFRHIVSLNISRIDFRPASLSHHNHNPADAAVSFFDSRLIETYIGNARQDEEYTFAQLDAEFPCDSNPRSRFCSTDSNILLRFSKPSYVFEFRGLVLLFAGDVGADPAW